MRVPQGVLLATTDIGRDDFRRLEPLAVGREQRSAKRLEARFCRPFGHQKARRQPYNVERERHFGRLVEVVSGKTLGAFLTERMRLGFGADLVVDQVAAGLAQRGHRVTVYASYEDGTYADRPYRLVSFGVPHIVS